MVVSTCVCYGCIAFSNTSTAFTLDYWPFTDLLTIHWPSVPLDFMRTCKLFYYKVVHYIAGNSWLVAVKVQCVVFIASPHDEGMWVQCNCMWVQCNCMWVQCNCMWVQCNCMWVQCNCMLWQCNCMLWQLCLSSHPSLSQVCTISEWLNIMKHYSPQCVASSF